MTIDPPDRTLDERRQARDAAELAWWREFATRFEDPRNLPEVGAGFDDATFMLLVSVNDEVLGYRRFQR